jgi:O-antigen/teichoic acid export membrane protein
MRRGHSEELLAQAGTLGSYSAAAAALLFGLHLVLARMLGPSDYAAYGTYLAIVFTVFFCLTSVHLLVTHLISYHRTRHQHEEIAYIVQKALTILFGIGLIVFCLIALFSKPISEFFHLPGIAATVLLGFIVWFTMLVPVLEGSLKGHGDFSSLGRFRLMEATIRTLLAIGFVVLGLSVEGALLGIGLGTFIALALNYNHLWVFKRLKPSKPDMRRVRRTALPLLLAMGSLGLLLNLDIILVKHFFSADQAGVFAAASIIAKTPFLVAFVLVGAVFPKATQLSADGKSSSLVLRRALQIQAPLVAITTLAALVLYGPLFRMLFGPGYEFGPLLGFYVFAMGALSLVLLITAYMLAIGKPAIAYRLPVAALALLGLLLLFNESILQIVLSVLVVCSALVAFTVYSVRDNIDFDHFF